MGLWYGLSGNPSVGLSAVLIKKTGNKSKYKTRK